MRFTIKLKLALAFSTITAMLLISSFLAMTSVARLNTSLSDMITGPVERMSTAKEVQNDLIDIGRQTKNLILESDPIKAKVIDDKMAKLMIKAETDMEHGQQVASEKGQAIYKSIFVNWTEFKQITAKIRELALAHRDEEAKALSLGEQARINNENLDHADDLVDLTTTALKEADEEAEQVYANTRAVLIAVAIAAVLIAIACATWVTITVSAGLKKIGTATKAVAAGDLTVAVAVKTNDEVKDAVESVNEMMERLRGVVGDAIAASNNVSTGSQQLSATAEQMSEGASEQAASAEEASASMEQMAANIKQNADNAAQTEKISRQSANDAAASGEAVTKAVDAMRTIAEKITIVQEIARQTDLLALNAAVEAARAGEHGKGFAVVASEVRKLAERSQTAATEISALSSDTVKAAQSAGEMLVKLVPDIRKTAELVAEISAACREQDIGASQINDAIQQLDKVTQQNAAASEEMSATSEELASQSEELQSSIAYFRTGASHEGPSVRRAPPKRAAVKPAVKNAKPARTVAEQQKLVKGFALDMSRRDADDDGFQEYG
jgi:methyl-accepting chemotaxis protein